MENNNNISNETSNGNLSSLRSTKQDFSQKDEVLNNINFSQNSISFISGEAYINFVKTLKPLTIEHPSLKSTEALYHFVGLKNKNMNCLKYHTDIKSSCGENGVYSFEVRRDTDILFGIHLPPYLDTLWISFENVKTRENKTIHFHRDLQKENGYYIFTNPLILFYMMDYKIKVNYTFVPWFRFDDYNSCTLISGICDTEIRNPNNITLKSITKLFEYGYNPKYIAYYSKDLEIYVKCGEYTYEFTHPEEYLCKICGGFYKLVYKSVNIDDRFLKMVAKLCNCTSKSESSCPICNMLATQICNCEARESCCKNGHYWFYEDGKIIIGKYKH